MMASISSLTNRLARWTWLPRFTNGTATPATAVSHIRACRFRWADSDIALAKPGASSRDLAIFVKVEYTRPPTFFLASSWPMTYRLGYLTTRSVSSCEILARLAMRTEMEKGLQRLQAL